MCDGKDKFFGWVGLGLFLVFVSWSLSNISSCAMEKFDRDDKARQLKAIQCKEMCGRGSTKSFDGHKCECYSYK